MNFKNEQEKKDHADSVRFFRSYCVHYDSAGMPSFCKAGISYRSVGLDFLSRPCINGHKDAQKSLVKCSRWERPSEPAATEHADQAVYSDRRMRILLPFLANWKKKHWNENLVDVIDCPVCETGQLTISMRTSNKHTRGHCTTINCVRWIE